MDRDGHFRSAFEIATARIPAVLQSRTASPCNAIGTALRRVEPESNDMNPLKLVAIVLIVAGVLGLAYGSFSYTKDTTVVKLGPLEVSAKEKQTVNIPMWAGIGAVVAGGLLLVMGGRKG